MLFWQWYRNAYWCFSIAVRSLIFPYLMPIIASYHFFFFPLPYPQMLAYWKGESPIPSFCVTDKGNNWRWTWGWYMSVSTAMQGRFGSMHSNISFPVLDWDQSIHNPLSLQSELAKLETHFLCPKIYFVIWKYPLFIFFLHDIAQVIAYNKSTGRTNFFKLCQGGSELLFSECNKWPCSETLEKRWKQNKEMFSIA